jgi:lipopolysaccharide transport system permease protein
MELIIKPQRTLRVDWKELWAYRELFYFFAWRDIKARYKQTAIGATWAIFQPFIMMVVFTLFFNRVAGIKSGSADVPYAIFSYTGLLFWNYFSQSLSRSSESLVSSAGMITKVYFPRIIAPVSATIVALIDFCFALIVFIGLMIWYRIIPGWEGILLFLPMLLLSAVAANGLGLLLAALNVKYRDVRQALPFFIQTMLFLTPVIYPVTMVPTRFQWILYLNPMTAVVTVMRDGLLRAGAIDWSLVGVSTLSALAMLAVGFVYFRLQERKFADII